MTSLFNNYYPIDNYSQDFNLLENYNATDKQDLENISLKKSL